ncbi:MAG TPA: restriction endonuclease [Terriglobales bacterium]
MPLLLNNQVALPPDAPEILLQAVIIPGDKTSAGQLVEAVAFPWYEIIRLIIKDPVAIYQFDWRKWEEIIAGAYKAQGWETVILTPRSGDEGKDVIAVRRDFGEIRFYDQVKCYKPGHTVSLEEVDSMLGVMRREPNVSKGIVTTTSTFAPELLQAKGIKELIPYHLELRDRPKLLPWLESILQKHKK